MENINDTTSNKNVTSKSDEKKADYRILPGINHFYREVGEIIDAQSMQGAKQESIILLNLEIDNLEFVLRRFGPQTRDKIIKNVGEVLNANIHTDTKLYHIAQFRFAMLLFNKSFKSAIKLSKKLTSTLEKTTNINGIDFDIDIKIGISNYPNHADNIHELVRTAAFASYIARTTHHDFASYEVKKDEWEKYQLRLVTDLKHSLENQSDIQLAFQPIVDLQSGACVKVEGLCRWTHPELGNIPPNDFLPYVEQSPMIMALTEHTLELGLNLLSKFESDNDPCKVSINLSTSVFKHPELLDRLTDQFNFFNIATSSLIFEVTETNIMEHPKGAIQILNTLRDIGCLIAVDDFGTGHSSLAYIADLPIDIIKIDQCFIREIHRPRNQAIIGAAVSLATNLGLETIAEGIEDESQYEMCQKLGINSGQGYLIGKPMFTDDFYAWQLEKNLPKTENAKLKTVGESPK